MTTISAKHEKEHIIPGADLGILEWWGCNRMHEKFEAMPI
jgi:hypothetical protein